MLTYKYIDDGYYQHGWYILDGQKHFAETQTEENAKEICDIINLIRLYRVERKLDK